MGPKSRWGGGVGSSGDRLCQTSPIPRSPDGDNKALQNTDTALRTLDAMRVSDGPDGEAYCTNCYRQRLGENLQIEDTMIHPLLIFDGTHRTCVWQVDQLLDKDVQVRGRQPQTSWGWKHNIDLGQV